MRHDTCAWFAWHCCQSAAPAQHLVGRSQPLPLPLPLPPPLPPPLLPLLLLPLLLHTPP
jgi:hypothetical protein